MYKIFRWLENYVIEQAENPTWANQALNLLLMPFIILMVFWKYYTKD